MASSSSTPSHPKQLVKFLPFKSKADPSFWLSHNSHKLNVLRLSEDGVVLRGYFTPTSSSGRGRDGSGGVGTVCGMRYDSSSSITTPTTDTSNDNEDTSHDSNEVVRRNEVIKSTGNIYSLNTLESFKVLNKNTFLNEKCLPVLLKCCGILPSSTDDDENEEENIMDPNISLLTTVCITYCNLKTNSIVYWFGYPALVPKSGCSIAYSNSTSSTSKCQETIVKAWGTKVCTSLANAFHQFRVEHEEACMKNNTSEVVWCPPFFMVLKSNNNDMKCLPLNKSTYDNLTKEEQNSIIFAFVDPNSTSTNNDNEPEAVGWTLRNLIAYLSLQFGLGGCNRTFLSYRCSVLRRITLPSDEEKEKVDSSSEEEEVLVKMQESFENVALEEEEENNDASGIGGSLLLDIAIPLATDYQWPTTSTTTNLSSVYRCVGWENNKNNKPGPRSIDLRPLVSPAHLARQANDLNLRLMKWRALPSLDVDKLSQMKVLLLGAGTLGCGVARTLLGWGVRKITFVDSGRVSYSNPVRQSLFGVEDCIDGGKYKAVAAAESLVTVAGPDVKSEGVVLTIPMPGHSFGSTRSKDGGLAETEAVRKDVEKLHSLIDENDVVFLLTDTRESRWLPTVMALATETPMINAALGLDSWLVMRHGPPSSCLSSISDDNNCQRLGCYFCSDVVAPENSTRDRTLDQQCTVTRPGLAPIAASMATELMVAMFHHPLGHCAPAPEQRRDNNSGAYAPVDDGKDASSSALGKLPHQIRGTVVTYTMMTPTIPAFPSCTACSNCVVKEYQKERFEFVKAVCCDEDGSYLEKVSGLDKFREEAAKMMEECLDDWDDDDDDDM